MPGRSLPNTEEVQQGILECPQLVQNPPRLSVALQVIPVRVPKRGRKQITWRHEGLIRNNYPFFSDRLHSVRINPFGFGFEQLDEPIPRCFSYTRICK